LDTARYDTPQAVIDFANGGVEGDRATISLTGAYLVYAQTLRHAITEKVIRREFPKEVITSPAYSSGSNEQAKTFIPESPWAANARYQFKDENVYIYTESWEQEEEKKQPA